MLNLNLNLIRCVPLIAEGITCPANVISLSNLEAYYKWEDNPDDSSGNGYTASLTAVSGGTITYAEGLYGQAIQTGAGKTYRGIIPSALNPQSTPSWSTVYWIKKEDTNAHSLFDTWVSSVGLKIVYRGLGGGLYDMFIQAPNNLSFSAPAYSPGEWRMWVITISGSQLKVYDNATLLGTLTRSGTITTTRSPRIFSNYALTAPVAEATWDDISFFDRVLSPTEITTLYEAGCPLTS